MPSPVTSVHFNPLKNGIISAADFRGNLTIWNVFKKQKDFIYTENLGESLFTSKWSQNGEFLAVPKGNEIIVRKVDLEGIKLNK